MKRSPFVLLAALALPASALTQTEAPSTGTQTATVATSAPERVVKFLDLKFADPTSWQCQQPQQVQMQQADGVTVSAILSATDFRCLDCSSTSSGSSNPSAGGSNQMTIARAPDGTEETVAVPEGSRVRICADLVTIGSPAGSVAPTASPTPAAVGTPATTGPSSPGSVVQ
jgi:hypothetical protein